MKEVTNTIPARADPNGRDRKAAKKRMSISLSGEVAETLESLAKKQGLTQNEALTKAIALSAYFFEQKESNSTVLIKKADSKELIEVVFL